MEELPNKTIREFIEELEFPGFEFIIKESDEGKIEAEVQINAVKTDLLELCSDTNIVLNPYQQKFLQNFLGEVLHGNYKRFSEGDPISYRDDTKLLTVVTYLNSLS